MRKVNLIIISILFVITFLFSIPISLEQTIVINYEENNIKNIILFIGDGMGENHIEATSVYKEAPLVFESAPNSGLVNTYSYSGVTDSAASATAMATGQKVYNGNIATYEGESLESILEIAKAEGKKTGVVTTDVLNGATPAAFSAHANSRGDTPQIISSQITSNLDLLIGEGETNYASYSQDIVNAGYTHITDKNSFNMGAPKIFATLPSIEPLQSATQESAYLTDLVLFALNYLDNENGFVLMIEEADIDKKSHAHNFLGMIYELMALNDAVETTLNWLNNREDTLVMITADHETGGLTLDQVDTPQNMFDTYSWDAWGHTISPVKYYLYNYNLEYSYIDNTNIFDLCYYLVTGNERG